MTTMILYYWDSQQIYTHSIEVAVNHGIESNSTLVAPPDLKGEQVAKWNDMVFEWEVLDKRPPPPLPIIQSYQVDMERDRRIAQGLVFDGKAYQTESAGDRENILGAMGDALAAITVDGAQAGDLRWADPNFDFFWIASDNSRVSMDAQTCLEFTRAAVRRKGLLVIAASNLKAMSPIPVDYANDKYWPALTASRAAAARASK